MHDQYSFLQCLRCAAFWSRGQKQARHRYRKKLFDHSQPPPGLCQARPLLCAYPQGVNRRMDRSEPQNGPLNRRMDRCSALLQHLPGGQGPARGGPPLDTKTIPK
eukprot:gene11461-biopygen324